MPSIAARYSAKRLCADLLTPATIKAVAEGNGRGMLQRECAQLSTAFFPERSAGWSVRACVQL